MTQKTWENYKQNKYAKPSPLKDIKDRGIFAPVSDPVYGDIIAAQAQYKMTVTPMRTKWVCRPAGYDNEFIYLKHLGLGSTKLRKLKDQGII